jgi:class 3 adenylate cyclase
MPDETDRPKSQALERKLATILSADVAEYSRLMGEDEEGTLRTFRGHKQVFESLVAMHRGRIFNTAGDAILAEFNSAVEAVRCATDIQAALRTLNDKLPLNRQVRFRIGINLGDVMVQGQDLMGDGVNVAARIQTAAEPGGICISGSVHDQIRNKLSLSFQSLGERNFKNIQQPVRTFSITEAEGGAALPSPAPAVSANKGGAAKWVAAAIVALVAGGGFWAYTVNQRNKAEQASAAVASSQQQVPPLEAAKHSTDGPAATQPPSPSATNTIAPPSDKAAPNSQASIAPPRSEPPSEKVAARRPDATSPNSHAPARAPAGSATTPAAVGKKYDGMYAGPVCFAKTKLEPQRCSRGEGTITGSRITGHWMTGANLRIPMFMTGEVAPSGDLKMELHSEKPDGSRLATINLKGTIRDGAIVADGAFLMGRPATLNWQKPSGAAHKNAGAQ